MPVPIERLKEGLDESTLIFDRISAIEKLRDHQVKVNISALQQMSLAKDASQPGLSTPSFNAGLAMMLGLLGTFIGLAVMAQMIQFALPQGTEGAAVESMTHAVADIRAVLSGIKTAFSASLVGMVCAIICTVLSFRIRQKQIAFFEKLERFTTEDLLPATVPAVEDETLLAEMTRKLSESFDEIQTVSRQNREALQEMTAAETAFASIVEEIRKITKSEASRDLESIISQLVTTNRSVLTLVEQVPAIARAFEHRSDRLLEKIIEFRPQPTQAAGRSLFSLPAVLGLIAALVLVFWLLRSFAF
jgi:biopolymer transport protein ExbB/TolQ